MKRNVIVLALVLALTTAYAVAQMPGGPQQPQPGVPPDATQPSPGATPDQDPWGQPEEQRQQERQQEREPVDDQQLEQEVRERFQADPALSGIQINVDNGEVRLEGTVASKDEKKRAKRAAKEVAGVRKVHDRELRVDAEAARTEQEQPGAVGMPMEDRDDTEQQPQQARPQQHTGMGHHHAQQVCVPADEQALFVVGTVRSEQEKQQIRSQLQQIQGVLRVDDTHLRVESEGGMGMQQQPGIGQPADRPIGRPEDRPVDETTERPVGQPEDRPVGAPADRPSEQQQPQEDQWGTQQPGTIGAPGVGTEQQIAQQICVPAGDQTVYVIGKLQSEQDKQQVRTQLQQIGIVQVDDTHLRVETGMQPGITQPQDELPQQDRPHEDPAHTGEQPDALPQEDRPDDPALTDDPAGIDDPVGVEHEPVGVQDDQMTPAADTDQLKSQIESALRNEPSLAQRNVNVSVTDDAVEISGTVRSNEERQNARRIVQSFAGYRQVQDKLTVEGETQDDPLQPETQPETEPETDTEYPQEPPTR